MTCGTSGWVPIPITGLSGHAWAPPSPATVWSRSSWWPRQSKRSNKEDMPMDANAAVLYEVNKPLVIEDVEVLEPGPHEVRVRWAANGVCHSDLHVMTGDYPHPLPVVLGHEAAGVVEKIGAGVESVKPGDHVCSSDIPIRKDAPLDLACLVSYGVLAGAGPVFNRAKVPPGASVAVFGCGGVGLNTIQAARMVGAGKIIAVDVNPQKLTWAEEFGATHVVDASKEDPVARVQAIGGMGGVDFAFEVVGTQKTIEQAFASTHRGGTCVIVGVSPAGTRLSIDPGMLLQQRVLTGSSFGAGHQRTDVPLLIDLFMDGKYQLKELVSRRLPLKELNHAFDLMKQGEVKRSVIVYE